MKKSKSEKSNLINVLNVLKIARKKLLRDFLEKDPLIFIPVFKYENNPFIMNIAIENYFISWINYHFHIWEKYIDKNATKKVFIKAMYRLITKYIEGIDKNSTLNDEFIKGLLLNKKELLSRLMKTEDKHNLHFNSLLIEYEKDKAFFQRKINSLNRG